MKSDFEKYQKWNNSADISIRNTQLWEISELSTRSLYPKGEAFPERTHPPLQPTQHHGWGGQRSGPPPDYRGRAVPSPARLKL